ncbi:MAG: DUF11 domain-containing protein [Chloroflexales bacterium]|nr:DUF11 domain-containing protein [Chloroflexales bacterium]
MKATVMRALLFVAGLTLIVWGMSPLGAVVVGAAPPLLVTETPIVEPPTPTNTSQPPPTATEIGELTPGPTDTTVPTIVVPTDEPPRDRPSRTATPTASATATPEPPTPTASPEPLVLADPSITKSVSPSTANVGDNVEYTIRVTNIGGSTATDVVVEDTLPSIMTIVSASASRGEVSVSGQTVRVTIGELAPGETVTVTVRARLTAAPVPPNNRNLATVSSSSPDGDPNNNQASVPLDPAPPAVLPITGDEGPGLLPLFATSLGLALIALSVLIRRRAA